MGIPWRVAFALQADGWYLRDAIIWAKPNPMPSSVEDRCTSSYEFVFMLAKSERYFADMDAVRQPLAEATLERISQLFPCFEKEHVCQEAFVNSSAAHSRLHPRKPVSKLEEP